MSLIAMPLRISVAETKIVLICLIMKISVAILVLSVCWSQQQLPRQSFAKASHLGDDSILESRSLAIIS